MTRAELLQTAKPILFNTEMVRAILGGRKTVTRRLLKNQDKHACAFSWEIDEQGKPFVCLFCNDNGDKYLLGNWLNYGIGDILYVREAFAPVTDYINEQPKTVYAYKATTPDNRFIGNTISLPITAWHPSIHMPKEAARIFLRVTDVWVERLQDINTGDYRTPLNINREGLYEPCLRCPHHSGDCKDYILNASCRLIDSFVELWDSTVKKSDLARYGWAANPWVWVIEFEKLEVHNDT